VDKTKQDFSQDQHLSVEYHRSYRKLHYGNVAWRLVSHLLLFAVVAILILIFLDKLTHWYSSLASVMIKGRMPDTTLESIRMFWNNVWVLNAEGSYPSHAQLIYVALISVVLWILALFIKAIPLPMRLGIKVLGVINLVGCIYFWLWADKFPYVLRDLSVLYVSAEIGMWIAIPLMLMFALLPIPVPLIPKGMLVIFTLAYTYVFGLIRYAIFMLVIAKWSFLWMALLYFVFGAFFDFAFMMAFYSYFISLAAPGIFKKKRIWRWLYSS
jgi:hypothetical protein